jgi:hypothetical protein
VWMGNQVHNFGGKTSFKVSTWSYKDNKMDLTETGYGAVN